MHLLSVSGSKLGCVNFGDRLEDGSFARFLAKCVGHLGIKNIISNFNRLFLDTVSQKVPKSSNISFLKNKNRRKKPARTDSDKFIGGPKRQAKFRRVDFWHSNLVKNGSKSTMVFWGPKSSQ